MTNDAEVRKERHKRVRPKFLAIDFFCGAGGTTRGLIDAGGYVIAGVDKDARCKDTYVSNNVNGTVDHSPVRFLNYDIFPRRPHYPAGQQRQLFAELGGLIEYYKGKSPKTPLLFAICAPCQPFTKLSRKQMSDERLERRAHDMNLLREACRFIRKFQPELILSENVAGIDDPKYGGVWVRFRRDLEHLGYATGSKVVCTSRFGVPQFRKRSILMAVRRQSVRPERFADLLEQELLVPEADPTAVVVSVAQAIGHLPPIAAGETHPKIPNHRTRALSDLNFKRLASAKPGQSNAYMTNTKHGDLTLDCHRRVYREIEAAMLFGRLYADVSGPPVAHDNYKVPQHLERTFRTL